MSTRFDSFKNKPNSKILSSKRKVLREFYKMQESMRNIHQEDVIPEGEEFFEEGYVPVSFKIFLRNKPLVTARDIYLTAFLSFLAKISSENGNP